MPGEHSLTDRHDLHLTVFLPGRPGRVFTLAPGRRYSIGRAADADVRIDHASVSRTHLMLEHAGDAWQAIDQVSKNGTRLDGHSLDRAALLAQCWLEVGEVPILVQPETVPKDQPPPTFKAPSHARPIGTTGQIEKAVRGIAHITGCQRAGLWLLHERARLTQKAWWGEAHPDPSLSTIRRVAASGAGEFCSDTAGAQSLNQSNSISTGGIRALFAIPLLRDGKPVAVAYADSLQPGKLFTEHDAALLQSAARQLSLILDTNQARTRISSLEQRFP
ncbi:MAG: GAF domain-containing protein [Wenzhouxiangellaceae bacterium]